MSFFNYGKNQNTIEEESLERSNNVSKNEEMKRKRILQTQENEENDYELILSNSEFLNRFPSPSEFYYHFTTIGRF